MNKSNNIIEFYMYANALKQKIRTGWIEINKVQNNKIFKEMIEEI